MLLEICLFGDFSTNINLRIEFALLTFFLDSFTGWLYSAALKFRNHKVSNHRYNVTHSVDVPKTKTTVKKKL